MWAMLQAAGAVLAKFGAKHPAVKWAVIALVGLFAVEFVTREGIALYVAIRTAPSQIEKAEEEKQEAKGRQLSGAELNDPQFADQPPSAITQLQTVEQRMNNSECYQKLKTNPRLADHTPEEIKNIARQSCRDLIGLDVTPAK